MAPRAWRVPPTSIGFALLVCLALSTQFLFQRSLYQEWPGAAIGLSWLRNFAQDLGVAAAILIALVLAGRIAVQRTSYRLLLFGIAILAGACAGEWAVIGFNWQAWPTVGLDAILPRAVRWLPLGAIAGVIFVSHERTTRIAARLHESDINRLQLEQQQVAVQLQVLQSQIEPHFLFNTLATIRRLQHTDPARGRETLSGFIHYLRSSLPGMREDETTLGCELDLITAYLDVLKVRMGARLRFEIDVDAALRVQRIPPLSIATLVENSIKHGLAHLPEGGTIAISARRERERERLSVTVSDTGAGLTASGGSGTGLANLRLRLRSLYGDAGALALSPNTPRGLVATLQVPLKPSTDDRNTDVG
jgi:signal transduction histidine kinase